ncbi:MAG: hypothetical protein M1837_001688 [Sclerophora amabilis]|nr:MAG: hypothetical protein M1837_001688 [Sclerophora amabilis]
MMVQEGMVFISMTSDDLFSRTAQYQIRYSPPSSEMPNPYGLPHPRTFRDHQVDGDIDSYVARYGVRAPPQSSLTPRMRHTRANENQPLSDGLSPHESDNGDSTYDSGDNGDDLITEPNYAVHPNRSDARVPVPPPFHVTTEFTDGSDADSDISGDSHDYDHQRMLLHARDRGVQAQHTRRQMMGASTAWRTRHRNDDDDDDDHDDHDYGVNEDENVPIDWRADHVGLHPPLSDHVPRRRVTPTLFETLARQRASPMTINEATSRAMQRAADNRPQQQPAQPVPSASGLKSPEEDKVLAPHARFFIKRDKSKCSIVFDPPV